MTDQRRPAFLFDIDGTLALHKDRDPYRWQDADQDRPNLPLIAVVHSLSRSGFGIVYVSGRTEDARPLTQRWLNREVGVSGPLYMRPSGDYRKDVEIKREIYRGHVEPFYEILAVFDDRNQVVRLWRDEIGLTCFQVADGDF